MRIKTLLISAIAFLALVFVACDDDLKSIGSSIQPDGDDIMVGTDTVVIKAETVSFKDSIYARTSYGLLGEYIDPVSGKIKSDYLCEFYCPENMKFEDRIINIDSISINTEFTYFTGDSVAPMGISIYGVKNPLKAFFFTSIDPSKYIGDEPELYGQKVFSVQDVPDSVDAASSIKYKVLSTKLKRQIALDFYDKWKESPETFKNSDTFKEFFKGVYVTTTFGSGCLLNINYTQLIIHYRNYVRNAANTADSLVYSKFRLPVTGEVIQMNHVENDIPEEFYTQNDTRTYMKTPAGVYTEITIPLKEIVEIGNKKYGSNYTINAANFKMKGFTEEEAKSGLTRPSNVLLINKDSLPNFFYNRKMHDNKTSFVISRSSSNSYDFGNLATIVNYYADHYKNEATIPDLKYLVIPISATYSSVSGTTVLTDIYNLMYPTSSIFRTDPNNMKMSVIYSKYNSTK